MHLPVPPAFFLPSSVGLDISEDAVRVVALAPSSHGPIVRASALERLAPGVISDGMVADPTALSAALHAIRLKIPFSIAHMSIPDAQGYTADMDAPNVPQRDMRSSVLGRLEEFIPLDPNAIEFDVAVLPHAPDDETVPVVVSAIPSATVDGFLSVADTVGIQVVSVAFASASLARAAIQNDQPGLFLLADLGRTATRVVAVKDGVVRGSLAFGKAGEHITAAVASALGLSMEEAEKKKEANGLARGEGDEGLQLRDAVLSVVFQIEKELARHVDFWEGKEGQSVPAVVLLSGGTANLKGLPEYLAIALGRDVRRANPWVRIVSHDIAIPPLRAEDALAFASAIGSATRDERSTLFSDHHIVS